VIKALGSYRVLPALPTATVTELENDDLTFALNFKADKATNEQLALYGDCYADFVLTVNKDVTFNANGGADGYLSGQYDSYADAWLNVPFEDVTLKAGESIKIMEYAASILNPDLELTYNDVYNDVKDFNCGVFFTDEFLAENPDLEVTLELRMYNPADESENYAIGDTYVFTLDIDLPTATVTEVKNDNLTFAMNFVADEINEYQLAYYKDWYADFELTVNKDTTFNANGGADGYLSGSYEAWKNGAWVNVPFKDVTLKAGESIKIMEYAAELMGEPGLKYTYGEVYKDVKDFDCGVFFDTEYILANPDLKVTLELRMYNPEDESESYVIGETYVFTLDQYVAINKETSKLYTTVAAGLAEAKSGETVMLLKDVVGALKENYILVSPGTTLDLNGKALEAAYVVGFNTSAIFDSCRTGVGRIYVEKDNVIVDAVNDAQTADGVTYQYVPVYDTVSSSYVFSPIVLMDSRMNYDNATRYFDFSPIFGLKNHARNYVHEYMKQGAANSGVDVVLRVKWVDDNGSYNATQDYTFNDGSVFNVVDSWSGSNYSKMFFGKFGATDIDAETVYVSAVIKSATGVEIEGKVFEMNLAAAN